MMILYYGLIALIKLCTEKNTLFCRCLCLQKQNHVTCVKKSTIVIVHSSLYFFSKYFLSSVLSVKMFSLLTIPVVPTIKSLLLQQGKLLRTTETDCCKIHFELKKCTILHLICFSFVCFLKITTLIIDCFIVSSAIITTTKKIN